MTDHARPAWAGRLQAIQSFLPSRGIEAFVVSTPFNVTYLTGFDGSSHLVVVTASDCFLITDGRYEFAVKDGIARGTLAPVHLERVDKRYDLTLEKLLSRERLLRVGFEAAHVTVATLRAWQRAAALVEWVPCDGVVEKLRRIKDATELATFRRAGAKIASVASDLRHLVRRDCTEREVATAIETALVRAGFTRPAFPTIVASGPNSALPHARPTDRRLATGDLVVLDFGGVLDGYCVDLTRMAAVGRVPPAADALYQAVRAAQAAAVAAVRPGVETFEIDAAARTLLESRGFGEAFLHSTGHGLGLDVHEAPLIGRQDPETHELIQSGMVVTIEPGAYLEGVGGVRLEDDLLVTADGHEVLTEGSRDLLVV